MMSEHTAKLKIEIYDPPMCCPSGICGPSIDPALLDINEAILMLTKEYAGRVTIERYLLSQQGQKFMEVPEILDLLKREGVAILPVTMVDGRVVKVRSYLSYDELKHTVEETIL